MNSQILGTAASKQPAAELAMQKPSWARACVGFAASNLVVIAAPLLLAAAV